MASNATEDRKLVKQIARGDTDAVEELYRRYRDRLYRCIFRMMGQDEDGSEEVLQDTFLGAVRSARRFRGRSSLFTWMCGIARRKIADRLRRRIRREEILRRKTPSWFLHASNKTLPDELATQVATKEWVRQIVNALPERQRIVLILKYVEDMSTKEIAEVLGLSVRSVESLLYRARLAFREEAEARSAG